MAKDAIYTEGGVEVIKAMTKLQSKLPSLKKDKKGHYGTYATLEQVMQVLQPLLEVNELAVIQVPASGAGGACAIETRIIHSSGEQITGTISIDVARQKDPQAFGAAMTYARRYSLMAMFGMVTEDDDADKATMTLEKLLKEMSTQTTTDDMYNLRAEHLTYLTNNKFWSTVYSTLYEIKLDRLRKIEMEEKGE